VSVFLSRFSAPTRFHRFRLSYWQNVTSIH